MCELFGVNSTEKIHLNIMLKELFSHAAEHPHGWGMAFFYGNAVSLEKQPEAAFKSRYLRQRLQAEIFADKMIAHIRLATKGTMDYENTHPFVMRDNSDRTWTLAHNGTIFDCGALEPFVKLQQGQTDSERILCYLIDCVNRAQDDVRRPLAPEERFHLVDSILCEITPENKVNLLLYDGEMMYVHTNYRDSLYRSRQGRAILFSTRPLGQGTWEALPMNTLVAYRDGRLLFTGTDHGHEFVDSEEKMRLLFLDFAGL